MQVIRTAVPDARGLRPTRRRVYGSARGRPAKRNDERGHRPVNAGETTRRPLGNTPSLGCLKVRGRSVPGAAVNGHLRAPTVPTPTVRPTRGARESVFSNTEELVK